MNSPNRFQIYRSNAAYYPDLGFAHVAAFRHARMLAAMRNAPPFDAKAFLAEISRLLGTEGL